MKTVLTATIVVLAATTGVVLALQYVNQQPAPPATPAPSVTPEDVSVTFVVSQCTPGDGVVTDLDTIAAPPPVGAADVAAPGVDVPAVTEPDPARTALVDIDIAPLVDEMYAAIAPDVPVAAPPPLVPAEESEPVTEIAAEPPVAEAEPVEPVPVQAPDVVDPPPVPAAETVEAPQAEPVQGEPVEAPAPEPVEAPAAVAEATPPEPEQPRVAPTPAPLPSFRQPGATPPQRPQAPTPPAPPTPARSVTQISPSILLLH